MMKPRVPGLDVSADQHGDGVPIEWHRVAGAGFRRVYIKATELDSGQEYVNPWLAKDAYGAHAHGLDVGFYCFWHPASDWGRQVDLFAEEIKGLPRDFGAAIDLEVTDGLSWAEVTDSARFALDHLPREIIVRRLYSNLWFLENMPGAPWEHGLWYANPSQRPHFRTAVWQWSWQGQVPGIPGLVDLDWFYD